MRSLPSRFGHLPLLLAANVGFATGLFVHAFLYNFYLQELGFTALHFGRAQASLTAGGLLALMPAGRLVDHIGPRPLTLAATLLAAAGLIASALAESESGIYAASFIAGAGAASWRVGSGPLLIALVPPAERGRSFSWNVALLVAAGGVILAGAGLLAEWLEGSALGSTPFLARRHVLIAGALVTAASAAVLLRLPGGRPVPQAGARPAADDRRDPAFERRLLVLVGAVALWMMAAALVAPFFNVYFAQAHAMSVRTIGLIFGLAHVVTACGLLASAEVAARHSPERALRLWLPALPLALVLLAFSPGIGLAVTLFMIQGLVAPATNPLIDQLVLESATPERRGTASSWRNTATELSGVAGAALGGWVLAAASYRALFALAATTGILGGLALVTALRKASVRPPKPDADESPGATAS